MRNNTILRDAVIGAAGFGLGKLTNKKDKKSKKDLEIEYSNRRYDEIKSSDLQSYLKEYCNIHNITGSSDIKIFIAELKDIINSYECTI